MTRQRSLAAIALWLTVVSAISSALWLSVAGAWRREGASARRRDQPVKIYGGGRGQAPPGGPAGGSRRGSRTPRHGAAAAATRSLQVAGGRRAAADV